ncbi:MAG: fimbrial protein [Serratia sp. (in: enterobacteria)]|uniref:fimbrial protein n=1 Tax=Serratia sp. (in: enterobacteria) TaxID=616 RepID=UPI003F2F5D8C
MNMFTKGMIAVLVAGSCSLAAHAADTTITINGKVVAAACTVANGGSQTVTMPDDLASGLTTLGDTGTGKSFDVLLTNCPAGTTSVTAAFSGTADATTASKYANAGTATKVAVQLQNRSGTVADKGNGSTMTVDVDASKNATFDLFAKPYSNGGTTPGTITTVVLMNFTYN